MTHEERIREDQAQLQYIHDWYKRKKYRAYLIRGIKANLKEIGRYIKLWISGKEETY